MQTNSLMTNQPWAAVEAWGHLYDGWEEAHKCHDNSCQREDEIGNTWNTPTCTLNVTDLRVSWISDSIAIVRFSSESLLEETNATGVFLDNKWACPSKKIHKCCHVRYEICCIVHVPQMIKPAFFGHYSLDHKEVLIIRHTLPFASSCRHVLQQQQYKDGE